MSYLLDRRIKRITLLTIVLLLSFSSLAFADPDRDNGRGRVQANYRDRDDDDRWGHRDRNPREVRRLAMIFGTRAGLEAGRRDRLYRRGFNYRDEQAFRVATLGYRRHMGNFELYRRSFREAFAQAYVQGYRGGGSRW